MTTSTPVKTSAAHLPYPQGINTTCLKAEEYSFRGVVYRAEVHHIYNQRDRGLVWDGYRAVGGSWRRVPGMTGAECRAFPKRLSALGQRLLKEVEAASAASGKSGSGLLSKPMKYLTEKKIMVAIVGCRGISAKTGKRVGSRHRWYGNTCEWCHRHRDQVFKRLPVSVAYR